MNRRKSLYTLSQIGAVGISLSALTLLDACKAETEVGGYTPKSCSPHQWAMMTRLSDIMIPRGDSLGALDVHVPERVDRILTERIADHNRQQVLLGFDLVDRKCQMDYNVSFVDVNDAQALDLMRFLSVDGTNNDNPSTHFFFIIRGLIVLAFFQSELVNKELLKYDPIPGEYKGCIPLRDVGGQWTRLS